MSKQEDWVTELCIENFITDTRVLTPENVKKYMIDFKVAFPESLMGEEAFKRLLRKGKMNYLKMNGVESDDEELLEANVKFKKEKQRFQDTNRIERKTFREFARVENAVSSYAQEIEKLLKEKGGLLTNYNPSKIIKKENKEIGMIQISDVHANELINLPHNQYDITIASHRLFKLYKESLSFFKARGITEIVVAFTGDLMNSDRRLDELLNMSVNRAKATFVIVDLFQKFLLTLTQDFHISIVSVLGNESRVKDEMSFSKEALSDNYDYTIMNMLRLLFEASKNPNITFGSIDDVETIIEIKKHKILITHDVPRATATQKGTQSVVGMKYLQGNPIDCMISGHIHSTNNQVYGYRSSALCGSNSYSDNALHLAGRAGQNIYIFGEGYRHVISIDLQEYDENELFDIASTLMEYDARSIEKNNKKNNKEMSLII